VVRVRGASGVGLRRPAATGVRGGVGRSLALCALVVIGGGCQWSGRARVSGNDAPRMPPSADTAFTTAEPHDEQPAPRQPRVVYELAVLHARVPHDAFEQAAQVWSFLREDVLDADTQLRLRNNGLRIGIGHQRRWGEIRDTLEAAGAESIVFPQPLRAPAGFSIGLELDTAPREQTLFYMGPDGVLSGATWPESRNVLRVSYYPDVSDIHNVRLFVVPEVYRQRGDWKWIRSQAGIAPAPDQAREVYSAVAFNVVLEPGEFLLIAPSENARIRGLLGGAFLSSLSAGRWYDSYIFLRPEAKPISEYD